MVVRPSGLHGLRQLREGRLGHMMTLYREALLHRPMRVIVPTERSPDLL